MKFVVPVHSETWAGGPNTISRDIHSQEAKMSWDSQCLVPTPGTKAEAFGSNYRGHRHGTGKASVSSLNTPQFYDEI